MTPVTSKTVTSKDGTTIAYERTGSGPALIIVDGLMCFRAFGPSLAQAAVLAADFTVFAYDRRGRGDSGDTAPYAVAREVEDLAALIDAAGGSAYVYGISSGAALALEAAACGLPITKLALFEPPFTVEGGQDVAEKEADNRRLAELLAAGRNDVAVELVLGWFLPPEAITGLRESPMWQPLSAAAPTFAYDLTILGDATVPRERAARVGVPTVVLSGGESSDELRRAAAATAAAIPNSRLSELPGQAHDASPDSIAAALNEFFA